MSRQRSTSKRPPPEIGLHMECIEEELEPSQVAYFAKADKEYSEVQSKLDNYIKKLKAEVIEKSENCIVLQLNTMSPAMPMTPQGQISSSNTSSKTPRQSPQTNQNYQQMVNQGVLTRSNSNSSANTFLVVDPHVRLMVGQMTPSKTTASIKNRQPTPDSVMVTTRAKSNSKKGSGSDDTEIFSSQTTRIRDKAKNLSVQQSSAQNIQHSTQEQQSYSGSNISNTSGSYRIKINAKEIQPPANPDENNALGGLTVGVQTPEKPNTDEASNKSNADSKEVAFSKVSGKTFPSLVVVARPHLKTKYISQSKITQERTALDAKVKSVLICSPAKFTEWLIQQGLIRSEQMCPTHLNNDLSPVKLKLGMYSDISKFPYSGGYVWISDCCPSQYVSVFSGSIFEGAPHPPTTLLKLIYHWACQTNVQNIVQWVKVDNLYVKNFFTNMRAVCTQAIQEKYNKMGGPRKKIEVGVISLGTTSQDGNKRQVKVEVLGVMDHENKLIRLRAVEPNSDEKNLKKKFFRILQPLEDWVYKESSILTDFTVNKAALNSMGFHQVYQVTSDVKYSNHNVMEYLRRIVPRMFQNTLSLLSRQIIQQFLDELMWREVWGPIAPQAFVNIIAHMAEQTKLDVAENFLSRLNKVASNPFKQWDYSVWTYLNNKSKPQWQKASEEVEETATKNVRSRKRAAEQSVTEVAVSSTPIKKLAKLPAKDKIKIDDKIKDLEKIQQLEKEKEFEQILSEEILKFINEGKQILLENYYYCFKKGQEMSTHPTADFNVKCCVCNKRFFENIVLMKHIALHCQIQPVLTIDLKKVHQCDICFLGFNTACTLKLHAEQVHFISNDKLISNLICLICEKRFICHNDLVYHMHKTHVELEMPYECGVCRFRTSIYRNYVDHFSKVHRGEGYVYCPFCLKVVTISHGGIAITLNVLFYMAHLEKHQRMALIRDCKSCQLSFIHKGILRQHLEADHDSWKNEPGVESFQELSSGLKMPTPGELIKPMASVIISKSPKVKTLFTVCRFKVSDVRGLNENSTCLECEEFLHSSDHFTGNFSCLKCRYATCCERAMMEHIAIFHESGRPQFTIGRPIVLEEEMFCICGYSSRSGNRMAKHLALCERKSPYASTEYTSMAVQLNSSADNAEDFKEDENMLNLLGLIRKSPEVVHLDDGNAKDSAIEEVSLDLGENRDDDSNEGHDKLHNQDENIDHLAITQNCDLSPVPTKDDTVSFKPVKGESVEPESFVQENISLPKTLITSSTDLQSTSKDANECERNNADRSGEIDALKIVEDESSQKKSNLARISENEELENMSLDESEPEKPQWSNAEKSVLNEKESEMETTKGDSTRNESEEYAVDGPLQKENIDIDDDHSQGTVGERAISDEKSSHDSEENIQTETEPGKEEKLEVTTKKKVEDQSESKS